MRLQGVRLDRCPQSEKEQLKKVEEEVEDEEPVNKTVERID